MKFRYHILVAPFAAFGMILLWAAMFGNTFGEANTMIEEWLVCMPVYMFLAFLKSRKKRFTNES